MWRLIGIQGIYRTEVFYLSKERLVVGRGPSSDILLNDPCLSVSQAELVFSDGYFVLRNLDPEYPTAVNGTIVQGEAPIKHGDMIRLGESIFRVEKTGSAPESAAQGRPTTSPPALHPRRRRDPAPAVNLRTIGVAALVLCAVASLLVVVPHFLRTRAISREDFCISNMRTIQRAKDQWARDNRMGKYLSEEDIGHGVMPLPTDLLPYMKEPPVCPSAGTYYIGNLESKPGCTVHGLCP